MARLVPLAVSSTFVHDKDVSNQENQRKCCKDVIFSVFSFGYLGRKIGV